MQFDLLHHNAPVAEDTPPATTAGTCLAELFSEQQAKQTPVVETIGSRFEKLFEDYKAALEAWTSDLARLSSVENVILPGESYWLAIKPPQIFEATKELREVATQMLRRIVGQAEAEFAPPGHKLTIKTDDMPEHLHVDRDEPGRFSPAAVWEYLEKTYSGSAGRELGWKQAAEDVIRAFCMRRSNTVEKKGAFVVLNDSVYVDDFDKKYGRIRLSYSSVESVMACCKALAGFATWAERVDLSHDLMAFAEHCNDRDSRVESRKQYPLGSGDIVVVTFQTNFEYRIREDLAAQLNLFIGTYGAHAMRD